MEYAKDQAKAYARAHMHGLWGSIPYPFHSDGALDEKGLVSDLRHYIEVLHIDGFYCGGIINEFWSMTVAERKRAQELIAKEAGDEIYTITMTGHHCLAEAVELTRHAQAAGFDFVAIMNPYYGVRAEDAIVDYFRYIADRAEIGMLILNSPTPGYTLTPEQIARIAGIENICAIKNDVPLEETNTLRRLVGDRIVISDPKESDWFTNMVEHGQQVFLASPSPHLYQTRGRLPMKEYTELAMRGEVAEAKVIRDGLEPLRRLAQQWVWDPWSRGELPMAQLKYWGELLGLSGGVPRPPLKPLTPEKKERLRRDLQSAGLLR